VLKKPLFEADSIKSSSNTSRGFMFYHEISYKSPFCRGMNRTADRKNNTFFPSPEEKGSNHRQRSVSRKKDTGMNGQGKTFLLKVILVYRTWIFFGFKNHIR
jgi:hypothetical protein